MKRFLRILAVFLGIAFVGAIAFGVWFFNVDVDEARVQKILEEFQQSIPQRPPDDQNRMAGLAQIADEIEKIQDGWTENQKETSDGWKFRHFFEREGVAEEDFKKLGGLFNEGEEISQKFLEAAGRPSGISPFDFQSPILSKERFRPFKALSTSEYFLIYCDYLALQGQWEKIWPILDSLLLASEDLSKPPSSLLQMVIGAAVRGKTILWLAGASQRLEGVADKGTHLLSLNRRIAEIRKNKGTFQDAIRFEMFLFEAAFRELKLRERPLRFLRLFFKRDWKVGMRYYLQLLDLVDSGLETREILQKIKELNFAPMSYLSPLSSLMVMPLNKRYIGFVKDETVLRGGLISIALAKYRLEHKQYPSQLQELLTTTGDLERIFEDPLAPDRSFRYRREGEGYLLYSVGEDGEDNQGDPYDDLVFSSPPSPSLPEEETPTLSRIPTVPSPTIPPPSGITLAELIQRKPDKTIRFSIKKQRVDEAISNLDQLSFSIRAVPYFMAGQVFGMKLLSIREGSLFHNLGLRRGDILLAVNEREADIKKGLEIFANLKNEKTARFLVWREGKLVRINIHIN